MLNDKIVNEIKKRRIFGIISHPDAGKTTLTEKLLWGRDPRSRNCFGTKKYKICNIGLDGD